METEPVDLNDPSPKDAVKLCLKRSFKGLMATAPWYRKPDLWLLIKWYTPRLEKELTSYVEKRWSEGLDITNEDVKQIFQRVGILL